MSSTPSGTPDPADPPAVDAVTPAPARAWAAEDKVRLLEAALEFAQEPLEAFDPSVSPFLRIENALPGSRFSRPEILAKIRDLRRIFEDRRSEIRPGGGDAVFEICRKIWGGGDGGKDEAQAGGDKSNKNDGDEANKGEKKKKKTRIVKRKRKVKVIRKVLKKKPKTETIPPAAVE